MMMICKYEKNYKQTLRDYLQQLFQNVIPLINQL